MNREDRELLAELAQLNTAMAPLTTRNMEDSASAAEQERYAQHLITAGARLQQRADGTGVEDEVLADTSLALPACTVEPGGEP